MSTRRQRRMAPQRFRATLPVDAVCREDGKRTVYANSRWYREVPKLPVDAEAMRFSHDEAERRIAEDREARSSSQQRRPGGGSKYAKKARAR